MISHYCLIELLGEGGMGAVWSAMDTSLDREVAIKFLPPAMVDDQKWLARFEREAKVVAALSHPNIVTIHSVEEANGLRFFTMELVRGRRLSAVIPAGGLALPDLLDIAIPLANAVSAAHEKGIAHGDLKPTNIMFSDEGRVKVLDFGLARTEPRKPIRSITERSTQPLQLDDGISGTLPYMSPEQLQGRGFDSRSDIFSLGIILFEMTTGHRPFEGETPVSLSAAILKDEPSSISGYRPEMPLHLAWLIGRCLEKDQRQRLQSTKHLAQELEALRVGALATRKDQPDQPSIAVLPFADMSQERDQEYFCEGIAEEIINALMKIEDLHVASRAAAFQFKSIALGPREIGQRLGVRTLLEGSVRKAGGRIRITAQLTNVADGYGLWSEQFDRELKDIFAIQEEIARSIVDALGVTLTPKQTNDIGRSATTNPEAFDAYLQGRKFLYQYNRRGIEFARQMFHRAIELDPNFALGHAGIADCCSFVYMFVDRDAVHIDCAERESLRAMELDPQLAQAHVSYGVTLSLIGRVEESNRSFVRAIELDPNLFEAHFFYARERFMAGDLEEAAKLFERAMQVRPEDYQAPLIVAQVYDALGRPADAEAVRRRGINIAEERMKRNPDDIRAMYMSANVLVMIGERERGLERARRALSLEPDDAMLQYNVGCIFSLSGEVEEAIDCLETSARIGNIQKAWYDNDSNLNPLREHPKFRKLMRWLDESQAG
jgi:serine/threonine protein kinase/Tfp pilus assembly protein PilF